MTANDATTLVCPNCASTNTAIGGSGSAICTDCAHLWDPGDVEYPPTPIYVPPVQATVEEVFGPENVVEPFHVEARDGFPLTPATMADAERVGTLGDELDQLVGGIATLEGGQTAEVIAFSIHDSVLVKLATGDLEEVPLADVVRIMPPVVIPDPVIIPDEVGGMPADMQLALTLAQVIIRAGCESVTGTGASVTPGVPPVGYLPADEALHTVVERAAGLAVGMLIEAFELDVDAILRFVGAVDESAEVATETTEVEDESSTSDE